MGRDLGCFGHVADLRRMEVDPFTVEDFVTVAELEAARFGEAPAAEPSSDEQASQEEKIRLPDRFEDIDALLVDTVVALDCLPQVAVSDDTASRIRLGNAVVIRGRDAPVEAEEACATARGRLVAIGAIEQGMFKPKRVFGG
jgi:tRNA pseudouridine55 synthase